MSATSILPKWLSDAAASASGIPAALQSKISGMASHASDAATGLANDVYDVSTPNLATQLYKHITGQPNTLNQIPGKAANAFMMVGGVPEMAEEGLGAKPYAGIERRAADRTTMNAAQLDAAMKNRAGVNAIRTPFDDTQGAMGTIRNDIHQHLLNASAPQAVPPALRAAVDQAAAAEGGRIWQPGDAQKAADHLDGELIGSTKNKPSANDIDVKVAQGSGHAEKLKAAGYELSSNHGPTLAPGENWYNAKTGKAVDIWFK